MYPCVTFVNYMVISYLNSRLNMAYFTPCCLFQSWPAMYLRSCTLMRLLNQHLLPLSPVLTNASTVVTLMRHVLLRTSGLLTPPAGYSLRTQILKWLTWMGWIITARWHVTKRMKQEVV